MQRHIEICISGGENMAEYNKLAKLHKVLLQEIRGFRQENKEQMEGIRKALTNVNARLDEAEGRIEKTEERMHKMQ